MSENNKQFTYLDSKNVEHTIDIAPGDLTLVQENIRITDKAMKTKPTTFFKDAMKRFAKNKSSIAGAIVLGIIILGTIFVPVLNRNPIESSAVELNYQVDLYPKLFNAGSGFWDGTKEMKDQTINLDWDAFLNDGKVIGQPINPGTAKNIVGDFYNVTITKSDFGGSAYGYDGYLRFICQSSMRTAALRTPTAHQFPYDFSGDTEYTVDIETASYHDIDNGSAWLASYGVEKEYSLSFVWTETTADAKVDHSYDLIPLTKERKAYEVSMNSVKAAVLADRGALGGLFTAADDPRLQITLNAGDRPANPNDPTVSNNLLIKKFQIKTSDEAATIEAPVVGKNGVTETITHQQFLDNLGFDNANAFLIRPTSTVSGGATSNPYFWSAVGSASMISGYQINLATGSCRWDTYEEKFGISYLQDVGLQKLRDWKDRGWIEADLSLISSANLAGKSAAQLDEIVASFKNSFKILNAERCPLRLDTEENIAAFNVVAKNAGSSNPTIWVGGNVMMWRYVFPDRTSMPKYIFGTDDKGRDMFKYVFNGLRTSLILGLITATINFVIGLVWGAISGYYGGWTDILMERFTDILGGIPWIVLMTLIIVIYGSNFLTFGIALVLTGWIGTSHLTRTQFYRFKSREYILAARTLGASDGRLIFRHILPNAIGTIITSSVMMVPSVIFSEATISYILPGTLTLDAFGRILSENQSNYTTNSYLLWFPSVVMALMMISFNLFGNGLRDAFNPSLKGGE